MLSLLRRMFSAHRVPESVVALDDTGVERRLGDGRVERVRWDELEEVVVVTTDDGPWSEDVFFLLGGPDGTGCAVPQSDPVVSALLERLQKLPGFDNGALIRAMSSTGNARFPCWKR
jgi:hypothetical protein